MADDLTRRQIVDALDGMLTTIAKLHEQVLALKRRAEGVNPIGEILKFFDETWMARYTAPLDTHYEFNRSVDPATVKRWLKSMDVATLKNRITRYFADRDDFLVRHKHPFHMFIKTINTYAAAAHVVDPSADEQVVHGCEHTPRCTSDADHTTRLRHELRTSE